ncbi:MAG TPA: nicotinate-nucleotide adenylyltransferase [Candidatus Acidoferrales bacterium]|nr:nicotinate-nucleotide adenylyltransferase [Candidatus Acidoferrales bacterium]
MSAPEPHKASAHARRQAQKVALFGGSFDPIHLGHMAVASAAQRRFHLDEVHFIPCGRPPHKHRHDIVPFPHRYAMVTLACAGHQHFLPSLAEAGTDLCGRQVFYSIDTVRHFRQVYGRHGDSLYFILGADSFLEIPTWKEYEALLGSCDFIVASRPGFRMDALLLVIPPELLSRTPALGPRAIALRQSTVHLLDAVTSPVSATEVRRRAHRRQSIHGLVPSSVEEYISKQALYR